MQIAAQKLSTYEQLEAKLLSEETALKMENQEKEDGEALFMHRDRNRRPPSGMRSHHPPTPQGSRFSSNGRWRSESSNSSAIRPFNQEDQGGSSSRHLQTQPAANSRNASSAQYQPRFRSRGPNRPRNDKCNFCGLPGLYERECDLRSILDRMKDYEHRLLEQRQRNLDGHVHHLEEPSELFSQDQPPDGQETTDKIVDACLIELNLLETPQNSASWYLDSGATHHVSGEESVFTSIRSTSGAQVRSAGGHSQLVAGIGDVALHFSSGK